MALAIVQSITGGCTPRPDPNTSLALRIPPSEIPTTGPDRYTRWIENETELDMSQPHTASVARSAMRELGFEIFSDASKTHYVRSQAREVPIPAVCDCGSLENGVALDGKADLILYVSLREIAPGRTRVELESECATYMNQQKILCASAGEFELDFWDELAEEVARSRRGDAEAGENAEDVEDAFLDEQRAAATQPTFARPDRESEPRR